jgi:predicted secreted protein
MASTGVILGTTLRAYKSVSGTKTPVGHATSFTLDLTRDTLEIADKDNSSNYKEFKTGQKSATLSVDAFISEDTANVDPYDLYDDWDAGTEITMYATTNTVGDRELTFTAVITNLSYTGTVNELATYSATFSVTGAITKQVIT